MSPGSPDAEVIALSVVIPCRNAAWAIGEQLEALTRQRVRGAWEVVVVDDASTDGSADVVDRYRDRLNLVLVSNADGRHNPAAARNRGVREARGEFILFCDADDVVDDGWAAAMQDAFREHDFVCARWGYRRLNAPAAIAAYGGNHEGLFYWTSEPSASGHGAVAVASLPFGGTGVLGVRRSLHESVGGFDEFFERGGEDEDYCWRIQRDTGTRLFFARDAVIHYRYRTSPTTMFRQARNGGASRVSLWMRWREQLPVPEPQWSAGLWAWTRVLAQLRHVHSRGSFGRWLRMVGDLAGHAEASARYGVVLLCTDASLARRVSTNVRRS